MTDGPTWSDIADWYDELLMAGSGPHATALACLEGLVVDDVAGRGARARLVAG